jgi:hypothetical protein
MMLYPPAIRVVCDGHWCDHDVLYLEPGLDRHAVERVITQQPDGSPAMADTFAASRAPRRKTYGSAGKNPIDGH